MGCENFNTLSSTDGNNKINFVKELIDPDVYMFKKKIAMEKMTNSNLDNLPYCSYRNGVLGEYKDIDYNFIINELEEIGQLYEIMEMDDLIVISENCVMKLYCGKNDNIYSYRAEFAYKDMETYDHINNILSKIETDKDLTLRNIKIFSHNWQGRVEEFDIDEKIYETVHSDSYPFIRNGDINSYVDDFFNGDENVLVFVGPAGTGKTKLIRHMLRESKSYDFNKIIYTTSSKVLESDELFNEFMTSKAILVLEDIDFHLQDRKDYNPLMYKLLGSSDGLITSRGKIIISTNVDSENKIDEALIRPGRCFDTAKFRLLNMGEANNLLYELGSENYLQDKGEYSLSQIYRFSKTGRLDNNQEKKKKENKLGF